MAKSLNLDPSAEGDVWDALVEVVRKDSRLVEVIKHWELYDGTSAEIRPKDKRQFPWLEMYLAKSPVWIVEADRYQIDLTVYVMIGTPGLKARDQLDIFALFRNAIKYEKPFRSTTVRDWMRQAEVYRYQVSELSYGTMPSPRPDGGTSATDMIGAARVELQLRVPF